MVNSDRCGVTRSHYQPGEPSPLRPSAVYEASQESLAVTFPPASSELGVSTRGATCWLSIVIPVFNEAGSLVELHAELTEVLARFPQPSEIIFVDDGSTDGSWATIQNLQTHSPTTGGIRFRRNFGKAAALAAGFQLAAGELILMMDADLQDHPGEIPQLLAVLEQGADVVNGWKRRRLDPWHKVYPSRVFNWLVSRLTGLSLHDHNCGFKLLRRDVAHEVPLYGELHRFIPVLAAARGFRVRECPVEHRSRRHGYSKYGFRRFARGFLDLLTVTFLTGYGQRPQHLLGGAGLVLFGIGSLGLFYLALIWCLMNVVPVWEPVPIGPRPLLIYSFVAAILGAQAMSLGFLAELIVFKTRREHDVYAIAESQPPRLN